MWQLFNFSSKISRIILRKGQRKNFVVSIKSFENIFIYFSDELHVNKNHQAAVLRHRSQYAVPEAFQKVVTSYDLILKKIRQKNHLSLTAMSEANFTYFQIWYFFFHYSTVTRKITLQKKGSKGNQINNWVSKKFNVKWLEKGQQSSVLLIRIRSSYSNQREAVK